MGTLMHQDERWLNLIETAKSYIFLTVAHNTNPLT